MSARKPRVLQLPVALVLLFLAPPAAAADSLNLVAHDGGTQGGWFEVEGVRAGAVTLVPGTLTEVHFRNDGSVTHNLHLGTPLSVYTRLLEPGAEAVLALNVPANATGDGGYWCDPHRQVGMRGVLRFEAPMPPPPSTTTPALPQPASTPNDVPALVWVGALAAGLFAAALRRRDR